MRSFSYLRAATLALGLGLLGTAGVSGAFAQDQFQRYDYARDVAPQIVLTRTQLAEAPLAVRSDASQAILPNDANPSPYNPEAALSLEGGNAW